MTLYVWIKISTLLLQILQVADSYKVKLMSVRSCICQLILFRLNFSDTGFGLHLYNTWVLRSNAAVQVAILGNIGVNPGGLGVVIPQILKWEEMEGGTEGK